LFRRKFISIVLLVALLAGVMGLFASVGADGEQTVTRGDYIYSLTADPNTGTVPDGFGTPASNGRIWTDKSVAVNGEKFDVNLKVLAQEYVSSKSDAATASIAADVVLVLDMTASMRENLPKGSGNVQRAEAMADSVNEAIDIITTTNPNNRIALYSYYGNVNSATVSYNNLPLAHYTSSSTSSSTVGKYVTYSSNTLKSSSTLLKDGTPYSFSQGMGNGTGTQAGIAYGVKGLVDAINAETDHSVERKPYVIVLTDGGATSASKNWYAEDLTQLRYNYITTSSGGSVHELISTATILTSAFWKDKLEAAYDNYNGPGVHNGVEWFNIAVGISESFSGYSNTDAPICMLNPNYLIDKEPSNTGSPAEKIKYYLNYPDYAPAYHDKNYYENDNYVYVSGEDGYITFANTYEVLYNAFTTLAEIIQQGTAQITLPIVYHEGSGTSESDVEFTDVIGAGMYVTDITLHPDGRPAVIGDDSNADGVYEFPGYKTTATLTESSTGQQTLKWTIPADEVAMYTFKDRKNVTNGEYITAEPTTLSYSVNVTDEIGEGPGYTNEFDGSKTPKTTVRYEIPGDNTYYYDVTTNSTHEFVSGALKSGLDTSTAKTENTTDSNANSSAYAYTAINDNTYEASAEVMVHLGNNGKVSFLAYHNELDIQVAKKWKDINGDEITDTSALPAVTVSLYRTADGSTTSELVEQRELSNSNSYTTFWNVPRKDSGGHVYTYSVAEDPPDGYYVENNTGPLNGVDGTITVTNRETPASGMVSIQKKWQTKIGTPITDTSSFAGIEAQLWRKVSVDTPASVNVKIYCQDASATSKLVNEYNLEYGSTLSFKLRANLTNKANAQATVYTLNDETVDSVYGYETISGRTYHYRETVLQEFTVTKPLVLTYEVSKTFYSMEDPCKLVDIVKTDATSTEGTTTTAPDELVTTETLNTANHWKVYIDDLKSSEVKDDGRTYNYLYYVKEISAVDGFTTSYSANNTDGITGGNLVITNKSTSNVPALPETGGMGELLITGLGVLIVITSAAIYSKRVFRERKRRKANIH
jgi:hypothetical protein